MRRLRENTVLETDISKSGDVVVEGHAIGRLDGFTFTPDASTDLFMDSGDELDISIHDSSDGLVTSIDDLTSAESARQNAVQQITRKMDTTDIRDLLLGNLNHQRWEQVASRCLSCANCTMVCPTCFCSSVGEVSDLDGNHVERQRTWDSCFNLDFSYMNGGAVRNGAMKPLTTLRRFQRRCGLYSL
jgi:ferredoxin